jgi:hypothetical protein
LLPQRERKAVLFPFRIPVGANQMKMKWKLEAHQSNISLNSVLVKLSIQYSIFLLLKKSCKVTQGPFCVGPIIISSLIHSF